MVHEEEGVEGTGDARHSRQVQDHRAEDPPALARRHLQVPPLKEGKRRNEEMQRRKLCVKQRRSHLASLTCLIKHGHTWEVRVETHGVILSVLDHLVLKTVPQVRNGSLSKILKGVACVVERCFFSATGLVRLLLPP